MKSEQSKNSFIRMFLSIPLRFKISIPYLVLSTIVIGLATYLVTSSFVARLEERFQSQLADSAARVEDAMLQEEDRQLAGLRSLAFTEGVSEAVINGDAVKLGELILPQAINQQLRYIEVLDVNGNHVASFHHNPLSGQYDNGLEADFASWTIVNAVVNQQVDELGDKYAEILNTLWGMTFYTSGPVYHGDQFAGVIMVGTPIEDILVELGRASIADMTLYDAQGLARVSTLADNFQETISDDIAFQMIANNGYIPSRSINVGGRGYVEALQPLSIRGETTGWAVGIALPEMLVTGVRDTMALQLLVIFLLSVVAIIGMGVLVAQLISLPVFRLMTATRTVAGGDLNIQVPVESEDELGFLTRGFNNMVKELRQREFIRDVFGRMVSEDVREAVLRGRVSLGGEMRDVAVLFTDIRGFTSLSEQIKPDEMIEALNEFFGVVARATRKHQGMINQFGGDSALIVFGAPIERRIEENLKFAILTAIDIRTGIALLNAKRIQAGLPPMHFGIGINSGTVVAGNLGSEDRFNYTVIGDPVNTAARLQGLSRNFPQTPILISADSVAGIQEQLGIDFQNLGKFDLKGKSSLVSVLAILGPSNLLPESFQSFNSFGDHKITALIASYLYCLGFEVDVIAKSLLFEESTVRAWLETANDNARLVGGLLNQIFGLPKKEANRLHQRPLMKLVPAMGD